MSNLQNGANKAQMIELLNSIKMPVIGVGGGFAPIGREGYQDGQTAPQGWLICDGSTHNIADYPELAAYIASHHGSTNYYGGDGVTTFAVPTRNGMPTSGVESPDEHIVGEWRETRDGVLKKKPVYEKTITGTFTPSSSSRGYTNLLDLTSLSIDTFITSAGSVAESNQKVKSLNVGDSYSYTVVYDSDTKYLQVLTNGISESTPYRITIQYTKTTDQWQAVQEGHSSDGNGVFCIKATVSGDPNGEVYSTEEHVCGHDEDNGDIVYERTIKTVVPNSSNTTVMEFSNKKLKEIKGVVKWDTGSDSAEESLPYFTATNDCCRLRMKNNNIICTYGGSQFTGQRLEFTIRYTKTS